MPRSSLAAERLRSTSCPGFHSTARITTRLRSLILPSGRSSCAARSPTASLRRARSGPRTSGSIRHARRNRSTRLRRRRGGRRAASRRAARRGAQRLCRTPLVGAVVSHQGIGGSRPGLTASTRPFHLLRCRLRRDARLLAYLMDNCCSAEANAGARIAACSPAECSPRAMPEHVAFEFPKPCIRPKRRAA